MRTRFTLLFIAGCAAGALLVNGLYGINKNEATPSWCLWACVFTGAFWLAFHLTCDSGSPPRVARVLAIAGANVLLAYLLSEMLPSFLDLTHLGDWYGALGDKSLFLAQLFFREGGNRFRTRNALNGKLNRRLFHARFRRKLLRHAPEWHRRFRHVSQRHRGLRFVFNGHKIAG